jgi:lysophospholipase L1-like esterase
MNRLTLVLLAGLCAASLSAGRAQPAPRPAAAPDRFTLPATDDGLPGAGPLRRMPWFQDLWRERRSGWAKRVKADQGSIVFLGDSITQGWNNLLNPFFPGSRLANRGISGDTTRGVLLRLQEDVLALNPRGVVLLIGTNDLEEQASPEVVAGNLRLILAALRAHNPSLPVVLCSVFPSSATKKRPADQIRTLNRLYFAALKDEPQVTFLDTHALFANAQGDARLEEFPDLLHPNALGYAKWAAALRPVLEQTGLVAAWPDDFTPEPGFELLSNGKDLSGWTQPDGATLDGRTTTADGRFTFRHGRITVTPSRVERQTTRLSTTRQFSGNFVLKLEFRASPNADSGLFVREPQLQVRDYALAGPFFLLRQYRPLDWNEVIVTVRDGLAHATCNGEVLLDAFPVPASGPLGLESDRGQVEYRRIRIRPLP